MLRRYAFLLSLGVVVSLLWGWWATPEIGEGPSWVQMLHWMSTQVLVPVILFLLVALRLKPFLWLTALYGLSNLLYAVGLFGWALMGSATPLSVYVVCALLSAMGLGLVYQSLKDLDLGHPARRGYSLED